MPDTFTPNLNLTQPEVGSSTDTWGTKLNSDLAVLDALFADTPAQGVVVRFNGVGNAETEGVDVQQAAGNARFIRWLSGAFGAAGSLRWLMGVNGTAEGGSNAGSDFQLNRYDDDGATLAGIPLFITRSTGVVMFETTPTVGNNAIYHQGNLPAVIATVAEPIGTIKMYAGSGDPAGGSHLICDGRAISRTTYATLFSTVGTTYGAGDGTTTFNIPNFAERTPVGQSTAQSLITGYDARVLGNAIGEGQHVLSTGELPAHTHVITDPGHHHAIGGAQGTTNGASFSAFDAGAGVNTGTATTGITATDSTGSGTAHNVVQPSLVVNFIIRVQ